MKMVISPAKSLNFDSNLPTEQNSNPCFLSEAKCINELLKEKTPGRTFAIDENFRKTRRLELGKESKFQNTF